MATTIEDMIVVVGAETDKLRDGFDKAAGIVAQFSAGAAAKLKVFDAAVEKIGQTTQRLQGLMPPGLKAIEVSIAALGQHFRPKFPGGRT